MKKVGLFILCIIIIISFIFEGCSSQNNTRKDINAYKDFYKSGSMDENYIELRKINDNIWVHISYTNYNGIRTASNGLIAVSSPGIVMIDTPWTNGQTKELLKLAKDLFNKDVKLAVITHAHEDRIGGIDTLLENNIEVRSTSLTVKEAEKSGFKKPQAKLDTESKITIGNLTLETYYPGEGHSSDNIVVWFPQYKVLFGGCIIKSMESTDLGSTVDANIQQWPLSVKKVYDKYNNAETVIPGHGNWGKINIIKHTLDLF